MMRALEAGGMTAASSDERDRMAAFHADEHYETNPDSRLYEVPLREYGEIDFPLKYQNCLVKIMIWGLDGLAVNPAGYRIVIMRRDAEERRQSYEGAHGHPFRHPWNAEADQRIERAVKQLKNRRDVLSVKVIDYVTLLEETEHELEFIDGSINIGCAAKIVDKSKYRFRRERLTVGI